MSFYPEGSDLRSSSALPVSTVHVSYILKLLCTFLLGDPVSRNDMCYSSQVRITKKPVAAFYLLIAFVTSLILHKKAQKGRKKNLGTLRGVRVTTPYICVISFVLIILNLLQQYRRKGSWSRCRWLAPGREIMQPKHTPVLLPHALCIRCPGPPIEKTSRCSDQVSQNVRRKRCTVPGLNRYRAPPEHFLHVEALLLFGPEEFKRMSTHVGTRNYTQVRSHQQKCFSRLLRRVVEVDEKRLRGTLRLLSLKKEM